MVKWKETNKREKEKKGKKKSDSEKKRKETQDATGETRERGRNQKDQQEGVKEKREINSNERTMNPTRKRFDADLIISIFHDITTQHFTKRFLTWPNSSFGPTKRQRIMRTM